MDKEKSAYGNKNMKKYFKNAKFISTTENTSVVLFKKIFCSAIGKKAVLYVCGLGIGYYYLNGKRIAESLFAPPFSDYSKTMFVNKYDVSDFLREGENVFVAQLGNGLYNEGVVNVWGFETAGWKGEKQLIASLFVDGIEVFSTNDSWFCRSDDFYLYNDLRIGESVDFNEYDEHLYCDADIKGFNNAIITDHLANAEFRLSFCPPVREINEIKPFKTFVFNGRRVIDFGRNFSGYVRFAYKGKKGQTVKLFYSEDFDGENLVWHNMGMFYTSDRHVQSDELILSGKKDIFKPRFSYYGFRYVEIIGDISDDYEIAAYFVHADVKRQTSFNCSDVTLTKLYNAAINSSFSNMFYCVTDCPSREKLPWVNDLACSTAQFALNFDAKSLLKKCAFDIAESQDEKGLIGGIAPTCGWGYNYGCGMTGSSLFEFAYCFYTFYSDDHFIRKYLPNMIRFYNYYYKRTLKEEEFCYLADWMGYKNSPTNKKFIELCYALYFQEKLLFFAKIINDNRLYDRILSEQAEIYKQTARFVNGDGFTLNDFTSLCLAIRFNFGDKDVIIRKLENILSETDFAPIYGLVGFRFFIDIVEQTGRVDLLINLLKSNSGKFVKMVERGDTLWEHDNFSAHVLSLNHHMFSCFITVFIKCVLGLKAENSQIVFDPVKNVDIESASGSLGCGKNKVSVSIRRKSSITVEISIPRNNYVVYKGEYLPKGIHKFEI